MTDIELQTRTDRALFLYKELYRQEPASWYWTDRLLLNRYYIEELERKYSLVQHEKQRRSKDCLWLCARCRSYKPEESFYRANCMPANWCKDCSKQRARERTLEKRRAKIQADRPCED